MNLSDIPRRILGVAADFVRDEPFITGLAGVAATEFVVVNLGLPPAYGGFVAGGVAASAVYLVRSFVTPAGSVEDRIAKAVERIVPVSPPHGVPVPAPEGDAAA